MLLRTKVMLIDEETLRPLKDGLTVGEQIDEKLSRIFDDETTTPHEICVVFEEGDAERLPTAHRPTSKGKPRLASKTE